VVAAASVVAEAASKRAVQDQGPQSLRVVNLLSEVEIEDLSTRSVKRQGKEEEQQRVVTRDSLAKSRTRIHGFTSITTR
jgi:hypothetical protein